MEIFRVSTYYEAPDGMNIVNLAAACPTYTGWNRWNLSETELLELIHQLLLSLTGGVLFNDDTISWHVPRHVTPLVDSSFEIVEMHMGISGQRLDSSQMATRGYTLTITDFHIVIEMPVGSPDGYCKVGRVSLDLICMTLVTGPFACFIKMP